MIRIYGASDDLVEISGCEGADEFCTDRFVANIVGPGAAEQIHVHVWYDEDGTWQISIGQVDEDVKLPAWPLKFSQGVKGETAAYSVVLEIDAPEGTRLDVLRGGRP